MTSVSERAATRSVECRSGSRHDVAPERYMNPVSRWHSVLPEANWKIQLAGLRPAALALDPLSIPSNAALQTPLVQLVSEKLALSGKYLHYKYEHTCTQ